MLRTSIRRLAAVVAVAMCLPAAGLSARPPVTVDEYRAAASKSASQTYPDRIVETYNLTRVLDPELSAAKRTESLKVIAAIGSPRESTRKQLSSLLGKASTPEPLREGLSRLLLGTGSSDVAVHVEEVKPAVASNPPAREPVLKYLDRRSDEGTLEELVKLWAAEPVPSPADEKYKSAIEKKSGKRWAQAVLDAINDPGFSARGSAIDVLAPRVDRDELREAVLRQRPKTAAMRAMKTFATAFNYVPASRAELIACDYLLQARQPYMADASAMYQKWQRADGYRFNVCDFHLLSRLQRDPLRKDLSRKDLSMDVLRGTLRRRHVTAGVVSTLAVKTDDFSRQVEKLSMADLWNLYLLEEMFRRPRVRMALKILAERDRADTDKARGGLIVYESGQAEARLYKPPADAGSDRYFVPSKLMEVHGRDALVRFICHFARAQNAGRAGPTSQELQDAQVGNYYGLVLTSVGEDAFCAHYYTPDGLVVSLGKFSYGR